MQIHIRKEKTKTLKPKPIIIIEGLLILHLEKMREKIALKIFLDTDDDIRLSRRVIKDTFVKNIQLEKVIERYEKFVKPAHEKYVLPSKKHADIIIPSHGAEDLVLVTEKLGKIDPASLKNLTSKEINEMPELQKMQSCDNMAIALIVEFIHNKLKKFKNMPTQMKI